MNFFGGGRRLDFCGNLDHDLDPLFQDLYCDPDPLVFKRFFIYCCDSYRRLRMKHENPGLRFELSNEFLVLSLLKSTVLLTTASVVDSAVVAK